jgi:hypothetical protein
MGLTTPLKVPIFPKGSIDGDRQEPLQTVYETSATQLYDLGTLLEYADGRKFRYAKNSSAGALSVGYMTQTKVIETKWDDVAQTGYTQVAGATDISVLITTASTSTANSFRGGILHIQDTASNVTPFAESYKIIASQLDATDTRLHLKLDRPLTAAMAATAEITVTENTYFDVVVHPTTATGIATGVPQVTVPASYYFWSQTGGLCCVVTDTSETIVIGGIVGQAASSAVAGACGLWVTIKEPWGSVRALIGTGDEVALIKLMLD